MELFTKIHVGNLLCSFGFKAATTDNVKFSTRVVRTINRHVQHSIFHHTLIRYMFDCCGAVSTLVFDCFVFKWSDFPGNWFHLTFHTVNHLPVNRLPLLNSCLLLFRLNLSVK